MTTELVACEFEDSTNCIWNAQEQGNGIGESFIDIEGETFYTDEEQPIFNEDGWLNVPPAPLEEVCEADPTWWECDLLEGDPDSVFRPDGWLNVPPADLETVCLEDATWWECDLLETYVEDEMIVPEAPEIEVPEPIESVGVSPTPPEYVDAGVGELAETGTGEVVLGALLGIALVITGVVTMVKGRLVA